MEKYGRKRNNFWGKVIEFMSSIYSYLIIRVFNKT